MRTSFGRFPVVFVVFGLIGLGVSGFLVLRTLAFVEAAERAPGTVIRLERSQSRKSSAYYPVVAFTLASGEEREFRSSSGSSPPGFSVGERVAVLYDPAAPSDARIDTWGQLWGAPVFLAAFGALFGGIGAAILVSRRVATRRADELRRRGTHLVTRFQEVERNTAFQFNGRSPWRIVTQWQDPATGLIHLFRSENLWFDPTPYVKRDEITVYVDRRDLKRHVVDISFLPKLAA